jgi:hypothetical protein
MMPAENLAILKAGINIAKAAKELARRDKPDHRLNDQICGALRTLYFTPNGILTLLKELERSKAIPGDDLRERLISFNDREWEVGRALEALDFHRLQQDLRLTLATARTLDQIRDGKIDLRRSIQDEVNYYGQRGVKPDLEQIRTLIVAIEKLNAEILEVEKLVNSRALEH